MSSKQFSEVPYQNFSLIKRNVKSKCRQGKRLSDADLFVDPSFPPDLTSLTYVYTGDDRYEKMVFKRPTILENDATFCGVGGTWDAPFPWKSFKKRDWIQAAIVVASLSVRYLEKLMPGYRNCEQSFINDYIGAFRFNIWRFGDWLDTIIDDNLPCLQNSLLYCQAYGSPPEFWGPLLEKAYAKIMKTYESIEIGNMLNALSDLTGDICEFYTQDINPPENLFYIMYKSYSNRSLLVCWRNDKRLTHTGFHHTLESIENTSFEEENEDLTRYLHIITATTKFPTTDGRLIEMVRLKCQFTAEPNWHGKFSDCDPISWGSVSLWFMEKYKPLQCKDKDEYWMKYEDFRCNFGGLIIISGTDPFRSEGLSIERIYKRSDSSDSTTRPPSGQSIDGALPISSRNSTASSFIVRNGQSQNRLHNSLNPPNDTIQKRHSFTSSPQTDNIMNMLLNGRNVPCSKNNNEYSDCPAYKKRWYWRRGSSDDTAVYPFSRIESICSEKSPDGDSINGETDITGFQAGFAYAYRRKSAPLIGRNFSSSSLSHLTHSSFLATKTDFFRSRGGWKLLVEHHDRWIKLDVSNLSKCPRVYFTISKPGVINEMIPQNYHGKSHILVSLLQDYRRGSTYGQLVPIGFGLYKCKTPECKDFSKYKYINRCESHNDEREITVRFDLEEGSYVVVPYSQVPQHEGEFLLRILCEKDVLCGTRNGCIVS
ncbi:uncharacterized protein [Mytilus edulis]|uniref:uncharacterized protein n=1 Tax=Mytilus edulis TaxID=6550 RepID=UPI0039F0CF9E